MLLQIILQKILMILQVHRMIEILDLVLDLHEIVALPLEVLDEVDDEVGEGVGKKKKKSDSSFVI